MFSLRVFATVWLFVCCFFLFWFVTCIPVAFYSIGTWCRCTGKPKKKKQNKFKAIKVISVSCNVICVELVLFSFCFTSSSSTTKVAKFVGQTEQTEQTIYQHKRICQIWFSHCSLSFSLCARICFHRSAAFSRSSTFEVYTKRFFFVHHIHLYRSVEEWLKLLFHRLIKCMRVLNQEKRIHSIDVIRTNLIVSANQSTDQ